MAPHRFVLAAAGLVAALYLPLAAGAQSPPPADPALLALPEKLSTAMFAVDTATLRANCAAKATVVDEFPPYSWKGDDACVRWATAFKAFIAQAKLSGFQTTIAPKPFIDVSGDHAYMVAQVTFTAMMAGKRVPDVGTWTFVLAKSGTAWKITSLAWGTLHH
jgi:ketosteroid isomerase-like protein